MSGACGCAASCDCAMAICSTCRPRHEHLCSQRAAMEACRVAILQAGAEAVLGFRHDAVHTAAEHAPAARHVRSQAAAPVRVQKTMLGQRTKKDREQMDRRSSTGFIQSSICRRHHSVTHVVQCVWPVKRHFSFDPLLSRISPY